MKHLPNQNMILLARLSQGARALCAQPAGGGWHCFGERSTFAFPCGVPCVGEPLDVVVDIFASDG